MPPRAFEGPAGTGKTRRLIQEVQARIPHILSVGQRVLGLTFIQSSRRRLEESFAEHADLRGRTFVLSFDSFASQLVRRWRSIAPPIADFREFDAVCDACADLLETPVVSRWVAAAFPLVAIDEAQDVNPSRLRIARALAAATEMVLAADEFQCLNSEVDTVPFMRWLDECDVERLERVWRTNASGLLDAGVELRAGRPPRAGAGLTLEYVFPNLARFRAGRALHNGTGTRALIYGPTARPWAEELFPSLQQGFRSQLQVVRALPMRWVSSAQDEAEKFAAAVCGEDQRIDCADFLRRLDDFDDPPPWARAVASAVDVARRAHGVREWSAAEVEALCDKKAQVHRSYGCSFGRRTIGVMSIHAAKNQQFNDVVVLWGPAPMGEDDHLRRLLYNAISRAQTRCTVLVRRRPSLAAAPFA